jgi:hypothetical protein
MVESGQNSHRREFPASVCLDTAGSGFLDWFSASDRRLASISASLASCSASHARSAADRDPLCVLGLCRVEGPADDLFELHGHFHFSFGSRSQPRPVSSASIAFLRLLFGVLMICGSVSRKTPSQRMTY